MSFLPRLLAPVLMTSMMCMMCGKATPQSTRPEGIPSPDDTWTLPNRDAMNANTLDGTQVEGVRVSPLM